MTDRTRFWRLAQALGWRSPSAALLRKAVSFALIGLLNTGLDAAVFFLCFHALASSDAARGVAGAVASRCGCGEAADLMLVAANAVAWFVAVSSSYVLNSHITFAAESGRKLTARGYGLFVASGLAGMVTNTVALVVSAWFLPVWGAKVCAILVSFVVNFLMAHFVVFRRRRHHRDAPAR